VDDDYNIPHPPHNNQPNITPQTINQSLNPTCQPNIDGAALTFNSIQRSVLGRVDVGVGVPT
jgi:hypothetical protein